VCVLGYAKKVRAVPAWLKRQAYAEYGITQYKTGDCEVDHLIPLSLDALIPLVTAKVAKVEAGGVLVLFDDQSNMKIKTAGPATIPPGAKQNPFANLGLGRSSK